MKKTFNFVAIKANDIPAIYRGKVNALRAGVRAFYEGDAEAGRVDITGYKTTSAAVHAIAKAIEGEGLKGFVSVLQRRGVVYIVRESATR
jgi:hypothetical protein